MTSEAIRRVRRRGVQRWTRPDNRTAALYLGLILLGSFVGMLYLYLASQTATMGYAIRTTESRRTELLRQNDDLRVEIARWSSLPVVRERAESELGMVMSDQMQFVNVTVFTSSVVTAGGPGRSASRPTDSATGAAPSRSEMPGWFDWFGSLLSGGKGRP